MAKEIKDLRGEGPAVKDERKAGKGRLMEDDEKLRNVETIIYPDMIKIPEDMRSIITPYARLCSFMETCKFKCILSPLHDQDVTDVEDIMARRKRYMREHEGLTYDAEEVIQACGKVGEQKEPHYHALWFFDTQRDKDWMLDFWSECFDNPRWRISAITKNSSAIRYLAHMDQKSKHRYNTCDIRGFGGADLSPLVATDEVQSMNAYLDAYAAIRDYGFTQYFQVLEWAVDSGDYDLVKSVRGNVSSIDRYLVTRNKFFEVQDEDERGFYSRKNARMKARSKADDLIG